ncbi:MarR family winged helix-turn-helix transcriptional regulator [Caballeronia sp. DA-9]|uniref:MarR family winged helix-turn-helix transcriptional regulator n=1 Tax=Caballeronia sp. DA-9 TaxID=3436237 RepID=UPI003F68067F
MKQGQISKSRKTDVSPDAHLTYLIAKVSHQLTLRLDHALQASGITLTQFSALAHIGKNPGMSSGALAKALLTTPQAVTTLIRRLSTAGMILHDRPPRGHTGALYLTDEGAACLVAAAKFAKQAEKQNLYILSVDEQTQVFEQLTRLHQSLCL